MTSLEENSNGLTWEKVQELSILALRISIQKELSGAMIVHIGKNLFKISGPDVTKAFIVDFPDDEMVEAAHPRFRGDMYSAFIKLYIGHHYGPEWGDAFIAGSRRWGWKEMFQEARVGEFDGMFVVITKHLGVLFIVAEIKHHARPISRSLLESFAHRARRIGANKGYFISTSGFQKGAIELAKREGIALIHIPIVELSEMHQLYEEVESGTPLKPEQFTLGKAPEPPEEIERIKKRRPVFKKNLESIGFILK